MGLQIIPLGKIQFFLQFQIRNRIANALCKIDHFTSHIHHRTINDDIPTHTF